MAKQPASKRPSSRMIILLDGTWQTDKGDRPPTNINLLSHLILPKVSLGFETIYQFIYYDRGVGAKGRPTKQLWEGATGEGLEDIVRGAYRALSYRYQEGMEIYIFGFSRGAFSACSLIGYINSAGLLRAEHCSAHQERKAWEFYRKPRRYRMPADKMELSKFCWPRTPTIKCLGVFDMVGALGIPLNMLRWRNEERYGFHGTNVGSIVDYAFHALALDEKRPQFSATLWNYAYHTNNKAVEQVWFPGCHGDVGGGVVSDGLSNLPLFWMIRRIIDNKLGLIFDPDGIEHIAQRRNVEAEILGGNSIFSRLLSALPSHRVVNRSNKLRSHFSFPRHLRPMREAVHWSVFARMMAIPNYRPKNILHDEFWQSVFGDDTATDTDVVGMDECFQEWWTYKKHYLSMLDILPKDKLDQFEKNVAKYKAGLR